MLKEEGDSAAITLTPTAAGASWTSWCESCHSVPCSVYCRADAAYLCRGCDASIHTANSLASRHQRFAVLPAPAGGFIVEGIPAARREFRNLSEEEEEEDGLLIGGEVDEYLDLVEFRSCEEEGMKIEEKEKNEGREVDGLVPVQCFVGQEEQQILHTLQMDYEGFKGGIHYSTAASLALDVSQSSIEQTGVPENTMMSISNSQIRTSKGTIELFSSPPLQMPHQFIPLDREARVLRYREKRKNRKFQKIIRYASRKAYAERRPRIKGRFAKRTDKELEVDQMFAAPVMVETGYGVVPSY